ncbi:alpha/beta fold hydrolase [Aquincola tertiaricarbonis]|uniref:Alpha/beta fold hydrolase n=1 Tax=Aquincola tertiaricarbonis TaxID=391953 RepID=A0ABY4S2I5_AQUTE|nr:alpha/beta fold hydrolase [Aquincola tertiaricarbonis]URI06865.1 alpha/beta fold hydrolase [Aquincola tertiaricarbonis]
MPLPPNPGLLSTLLLDWPTLSAAAVLLVACLAAVAYAAACAVVAQRFTRARRKRPELAQQHPALADAAVRFPARDGRATLEGWYLPAWPQAGAVVFVHGKDACRGDELKSPTYALAQSLRARGLSVLMLDLRGHGESSDARLTYSEHERHDVLGAVDFLLGQGYAPGCIGLLGASMGASTALRAAAAEQAVGGVVADTPFADLAAMLRTQFRRLTGLPMWFLPGALLMGRLLSGVHPARVRPVDEMPRLRGRPVLVIHSQADPLIPLAHGRMLARAAGGRLWVTQAPRHIGSYLAMEHTYTAVVSDFFCRHLLGDAIDHARSANDASGRADAGVAAA